MTQYQLVNIVYLDNEDGVFLRYELGADEQGVYCLALVFVPQTLEVNGVNYTNWLEFGWLDLNQYTKDKAGVMQACRDHRANWRV